MEMLENKNTQKRRTPRVKALVLAAALAIGCVLSIAAGLPAQVYTFMSGGTFTFIPGSDHTIMGMDASGLDPVTLENGRLWLNTTDGKLDITDKVSESTPYIVENGDKANGTYGYFVAGGTPEDFGWIEFPVIDGVIAGGAGRNFEKRWYTMPDNTVICLDDLSMEEQMKLAEENGGGLTYSVTECPWYQAALDQLGLED